MKASTCFAVLACAVLATSGSAAQKGTVHSRIAAGVNAIRLIDTHEHIPPEEDRLEKPRSLFSLLHYVSSDMWTDGMDREASERMLGDPSVPLDRQWEMVAPFWRNVRTTEYGRNLLRAVRNLYGVPDISGSTYAEISKRINDANRPGLYADILKKRAGIDLAICDIGPGGTRLDPSLFRAVLQLDQFLVVPQGVTIIEKQLGVTVNSLADWENALEKAFTWVLEHKFVGIKAPLAYQRTLDFAAVDRAEAERLFDAAIARRGQPGRADWTRDKALQDYMFGKIADGCARHGLPLQIHTGLFHGTWRDVRQSNPSLLIPFVIRHKDTRFVLMHAGYPYGSELLAMAKNLPNVTVDMCWAYVISPSYAARFLDEAIETLPADKILAFGGDYQIPEGSYGHSLLCREVVAKVLADKVTSGYWSEDEALMFARAVLRENAIRVFRLGM